MGEIRFLLLGIGEGATMYFVDNTYEKFNFIFNKKCKVKQIMNNSCSHNNVYMLMKNETHETMTIYNNITAVG